MTEFWAVPVPAGVCMVLAGDAEHFVSGHAVLSLVFTSTGAAGVCFCCTAVHEVTPSPTFHALYWLVL